jgi:FixJ family two-component response regulator/glycine cleavage system H lipoate-binding protein
MRLTYTCAFHNWHHVRSAVVVPRYKYNTDNGLSHFSTFPVLPNHVGTHLASDILIKARNVPTLCQRQVRKMSKSPRILVVDDEPGVLKSCRRILTREEWDVDTVSNAEDALGMVKREQYDVIITDMIMPKMSGMDLLKIAKESKPEISIIMITGYATVKTAVMAMKLGAFDYIPKPFTPEELSSVTDRAIARKRLFTEKRVAEEAGEEIGRKRPKDRYYMPDHAWAKIQDDGSVLVGMDWVFRWTIGDVVNIDLPFEDEEVEQGQVCVRITTPSKMRMHNFWSPVSGKVIEVNEEVNRDTSLVEDDPYGRGWLLRISPSNLEEDLKNLLHVDKNHTGGNER